MDHSDESVSVSKARIGEIEDRPEKIISIVVSDERGNPVGILEKWSEDAWFYAEIDSLYNLN